MRNEKRSDSPNVCGHCGAKAYTPERFSDEDASEMDGVFNVCGQCEAECTGTDARGVKDRWYWLDSKRVAQGRAAMEAAEADAEWAESMRYADEY